MAQVEETIISGENVSNNDISASSNKVMNPSEAKPAKVWRPVAFGTVTGVLLGGGTIMASDAYAAANNDSMSGDDGTPDLAQATVSDDMSFADAFASARDQVGPGGVFTWHGGVYGTYTYDEWSSMSDAERQDFSHRVSPSVDVDHVDTSYATSTSYHTSSHAHEHHYSASHHSSEAEFEHHAETNVNHTHEVSDQHNTGDGHSQGFEVEGVRIVGYGEVEGHVIVGYDVDNDNGTDVAIIDVDDSGDITAPDIMIDNNGNMATIAELEEMHAQQTHQQAEPYLAQNPDVAPDMPDYVDDAFDA